MRIIRLKFAIIILAIIALFPLDAICAPLRKPIKFYCNLIKKSKFLFWNYESTRSIQIDIYDSDKKGGYDAYKWWEDGVVRHIGKFSHGNEDSVCERRLGELAKRTVVSYYNDKDDEYFIRLRSKKDNSNLGYLTIDIEFKYDMGFERYYVDDQDGCIVIPYGPSKGSLKFNIFLNFKVDRIKNKLRTTNLYFQYDDAYATKSSDIYEDHRIIISDLDKDGIFEDCAYLIDECPFVVESKVAYDFPSNVLWNIFYKEIRNDDIKVIDLIDGEYRIPLHSRRENFVIGYLDFKSYGSFLVTYRGITKFSDSNILTAARFGLSIPSSPYFEYVNFVCQEPGFLDPHLRPYRTNLFINEYLKERERASQSRKQETLFSLTVNDK